MSDDVSVISIFILMDVLVSAILVLNKEINNLLDLA